MSRSLWLGKHGLGFRGESLQYLSVKRQNCSFSKGAVYLGRPCGTCSIMFVLRTFYD